MVDSGVFIDHWFHKKFVPADKMHMSEKSLPVKALLLFNYAPAPDERVLLSSDERIKAIFLPPNTPALMQPMDQDVLESLKRQYRTSLLYMLLLLDHNGDSI